jgi:hypothetical protein
MVSWFKQLYKSLSISSKFFTIIDSDEFLYLYDGDKVIKDNSIIQFLEKNTDCNFFVPCYIENVTENDKLFSFNPKSLSIFNQSKPIVNSKIIPLFEQALTKYECPTLHHTQELPILTYGKTKTKFLLLHLKNLNKYQRIKTNMEKLVSLNIVKHNNDFSALIKIDLNTIHGNGRHYIIETRKLIESIIYTKEQSTKNETIEL